MLTTLEVYSVTNSTPPDLPLVLGSREDTDLIHIRDIEGLGPVKANIASTAYGQMDGEAISGVNLPNRNIVIKVGFNPDWVEETVASLREKIYAYFMTKSTVRLRFFRDNGPTVEIEGVVEDCAPSIFSKDPEMQISVVCPLPDFVAVATSHVEGWAYDAGDFINFTSLSNAEKVPFKLELEYVSGAEYTDGQVVVQQWGTGMVADAVFVVTGEISAAMLLRINSERGSKSAQNILPDDEPINLLNTMTEESEWLYISPGTNSFRVVLESGVTEEIRATLTWHERFGGL